MQASALRPMAALACALRGCVLLLGLTAVPLAAGAQADSETSESVARNLFEAGRAAFDGGDYREALQMFEQAYERSPRPQLLYNIGKAADRLRLDERALEVFRRYLEELPDAPNRAEVDNRIRALAEILESRSAPAVAETPPDAIVEAPTPSQTAAASSVAVEPTPRVEPLSSAATQSESAEPLTQQWWFWTAVGAVVVAGVVTTAVAMSSSDAPSPRYVQPDVGQVVVTLQGR